MAPDTPSPNPPEEHSHSGPTGGSVGGAGAHVLPVQLRLTAVALGAQHGPTEEAQGGVLPLIVCGFRTPEGQGRGGRGVRRVRRHGFLYHPLPERFRAAPLARRESVVKRLLKVTGLIEECAVILGKID